MKIHTHRHSHTHTYTYTLNLSPLFRNFSRLTRKLADILQIVIQVRLVRVIAAHKKLHARLFRFFVFWIVSSLFTVFFFTISNNRVTKYKYTITSRARTKKSAERREEKSHERFRREFWANFSVIAPTGENEATLLASSNRTLSRIGKKGKRKKTVNSSPAAGCTVDDKKLLYAAVQQQRCLYQLLLCDYCLRSSRTISWRRPPKGGATERPQRVKMRSFSLKARHTRPRSHELLFACIYIYISYVYEPIQYQEHMGMSLSAMLLPYGRGKSGRLRNSRDTTKPCNTKSFERSLKN